MANDKGTFQLMSCIWSMLMFDQRESFELGKDNELMLKKNRKKCLTYLDTEY